MARRPPVLLAIDYEVNGRARVSSDHSFNGGTTNFMSFERLHQSLRDAGDVREGERIKRIEIDERGLTVLYARQAT